jgi:hypothetical protein
LDQNRLRVPILFYLIDSNSYQGFSDLYDIIQPDDNYQYEDNTLLDYAQIREAHNVISKLIKSNGTNLQRMHSQTNQTPFSRAIFLGHYPHVKEMLKLVNASFLAEFDQTHNERLLGLLKLGYDRRQALANNVLTPIDSSNLLPMTQETRERANRDPFLNILKEVKTKQCDLFQQDIEKTADRLSNKIAIFLKHGFDGDIIKSFHDLQEIFGNPIAILICIFAGGPVMVKKSLPLIKTIWTWLSSEEQPQVLAAQPPATPATQPANAATATPIAAANNTRSRACKPTVLVLATLATTVGAGSFLLYRNVYAKYNHCNAEKAAWINEFENYSPAQAIT